ncbi:MAG: S9 family peptidase [Firmicutes bacterium]|nr:S9 family peptidase [Bacillota bacterium]
MGRRLRLEDYYLHRSVLETALSPDGRLAAVVVRYARRRPDEHQQSLWLLATDGSQPPHRLTRGATHDRAPAWSPDGRYLAFLSSRADEVEVADARPSGEGDERPAADAGSPPGKGRRGEARAQIWCLDLRLGGEPRQLTDRPEGVAEFAWSPDGRTLAFAARDPSEEERRYLAALREGRGPVVIDRVQHKFDGQGFLDDVRTHLFLLDLATRRVRRLTSGPSDERQPCFSPDGRWVAFVSNRTGDPDNNRRNDLWMVAVDGGEARRLTLGDVDARWPRFSPDGRWVAFVSPLEPENVYKLSHLLAVPVEEARPVEDLAGHVGKGWRSIGGVVPDLPPAALAGPGALPEEERVRNARRYPEPLERTPARLLTAGLDRPVEGPPLWLDGGILLATVADRGQRRLARLRLETAPALAAEPSGVAGRAPEAAREEGAPAAELLLPFRRDRTLLQAQAAAGRLLLLLDSPQGGQEVVSGPLEAAERPEETAWIPLFRPQAELLAECEAARMERIAFRDGDGWEVEGLVTLPPGWEPARGARPLLVVIHGGPMAYDQPAFRFDVQWWAGLGYLVLQVNYRGSTGYGERFCEVIRGDWGPREHDDVMCGVEELVRRGWADPERLFVTGFSQGGIMTNWAIGHTDRFRAAVSEHGMWEYAAAFGTDDSHLWWQDDLGVPWQNPEGYRRIAPAQAVASIRTPVLIMAGQEDWRCPLDQAEMMYVALRKRGLPAELVVWPGEHHAVSRPRRAVDRLRRAALWLERWGGQRVPEEDRRLPETGEAEAGRAGAGGGR